MAIIPNDQKILTSAAEVNTKYGGPASLQSLNTWYTMQDISNTVRPYKVYTALLTQSDEDAPVAIILENTLGTEVTFGYISTGVYSCQLGQYPDPNKVIVFGSITNYDAVNNPIPFLRIYYGGGGGIDIETYLCDPDGQGIRYNNILYKTPVEIRVYN
jgi:hypothetical protein